MDNKTQRLLDAFYNHFENDNHHAVCSLINWIFNLYHVRYFSEFQPVIDLLTKFHYVVNVERDDSTGEWATKKYKMIVSFEEVK